MASTKRTKSSTGITKDELSRRFILNVTKSGHVFIQETGQPAAPGEEGGLPVFSTATREQAAMIRVHFCRLARDRSGLYRLNRCLGDDVLEIEALDEIADEFRAHFARQVERHAQRRGYEVRS
jgi:hypothetical protein